MAEFSQRFKELRKYYKLKQEEIAEELEVSKNTISVWERGIRLPEFETIERICQEFNVTMAWLMGGEVKEEPEEPDDAFFAECSQEEDDEWLRHIIKVIAQLSPGSRETVASAISTAYKQDKRKGRLDIQKAQRIKIRFEEEPEEEPPGTDESPPGDSG